MINHFIEKVLKIKNYKIILFNSGKDNITYEIIPKLGESFIVQKVLSKKTEKNILFINNIISFTNNSTDLSFAKNYTKDRFINYNGELYQIMKKIEGKTIENNNLNIDIIKKTAQYIAIFHKHISKFDYSKYIEINYYKKLHKYRLEAQNLISSKTSIEVLNIFTQMNNIAKKLKENNSLPIGVIHGDPSFKNFILKNNKIEGLIDYDMLSVNTILWDLVDLIRSYLKSKVFNKKEFEILINSYNEIRELSNLEKKELKNYCKMMILDTGFRYLLSYFNSSSYNNFLGDKEASLKKANKCLIEIQKLESFYK